MLSCWTSRPALVGGYFQELDVAVPTKKLHLAALRKFFDRLVNRHAIYINPAATVRAKRYAAIEGKTPEIQPKQAEALLRSIETTYQVNSETRPDLVGLRDRAVLAVLVFTAARVGAVARLAVKSLRHDGTDYALRFSEKGGKSREIPVRHDLQKILLAYIQAAGISDGPLFPTAMGKTKTLTGNPMTGIDICRMMKRRLKAAGLSTDSRPTPSASPPSPTCSSTTPPWTLASHSASFDRSVRAFSRPFGRDASARFILQLRPSESMSHAL